MKKFTLWIKSHPLKFTALFTCSLVSGAVMAGDFAIGLMLLALVYAMWLWVFYADTRIAIVLLAACMVVPVRAEQQFEPAAGYVLGGIVVLVGAGLGWVGCRTVKACKRISRRNSPGTNAERFAVTSEYGAAYFWPEEYCHEERSLPRVPVSFVLDITVESASNATVTVSAATGHEFVQPWSGLKDELDRHGLASTAGQSFSRNRHPCESGVVPVSFNATSRVVTIGEGGVLVTIERSADLHDWEPLMALDVEAGGRPLQISDVSDTQQFYRVTTR